MPPVLKILCSLFAALNAAKMLSMGFNLSHNGDDRSIVWAAAVAAIGMVLLFALLICFAQRRRNSLTLLRGLVAVIVACQLIFFFAGWLTPFQEASPLLKLQQLLDWSEALTCVALSVLLRRQSTKSWFVAKLSQSRRQD